MRETKRRVEQFRFYDAVGVEAHLAKMAAKGWQLEKITPTFWHYRWAEPQQVTYAVTYFPNASDFDPAPTEDQQTMRAYCEASGWVFVAQWAQMQIFSTTRERPIPIETEERVRLEITHKAMKRNFLLGNAAMIAVAVLQVCSQISLRNYDVVGKLASGLQLYLLLLWVMLLAYFLVVLLGYGQWYRLSKRAVEQGGACAVCGSGYRKVGNALLAVTFVLLLGLLWQTLRRGNGLIAGVSLGMMAVMLLGVAGVKAGLKRAKLSRGLSRGLTMAACVVLTFAMMGGILAVVMRGLRQNWFEKQPVEQYETINGGQSMLWDIYHDPLPLTVEDLAEVDYAHYTYELTEESSILAARTRGRQAAFPDGEDAPTLFYQIVEVRAGIFYDLCLKQYVEAYRDWDPEASCRPVDAAPWQADAVYRAYDGETAKNRFVVCWGKRIVQIEFPFEWDVTAEQIAIATEKLRG